MSHMLTVTSLWLWRQLSVFLWICGLSTSFIKQPCRPCRPCINVPRERSRTITWRLWADWKTDPTTIDTIGGYPGIILKYNEQQELETPNNISTVMDFCRKHQLTDLCLTVHGWLTNSEDAIQNYERQYKYVREQTHDRLPNRTIGVMGLIWPANRYECSGHEDCDLIVKQLESVEGQQGPIGFEAIIVAVKAIVFLKDNLDETENARQLVKDAIGDFLLAISDTDKEESLAQVSTATSHLLNALEDVAEDDLKSFLESFLAQVGNLIDVTSYFSMMERSRHLGKCGISKLIQDVK